jgi:hypothetical protein
MPRPTGAGSGKSERPRLDSPVPAQTAARPSKTGSGSHQSAALSGMLGWGGAETQRSAGRRDGKGMMTQTPSHFDEP